VGVLLGLGSADIAPVGYACRSRSGKAICFIHPDRPELFCVVISRHLAKRRLTGILVFGLLCLHRLCENNRPVVSINTKGPPPLIRSNRKKTFAKSIREYRKVKVLNLLDKGTTGNTFPIKKVHKKPAFSDKSV